MPSFGRPIYREEREMLQFLFGLKMIVGKIWVPKDSPIAQCFKYIGTIIPRYTIIK